MKPVLLAGAAALLVGCIEPPPPTTTIASAITVDAAGCPEVVAAVITKRNDKVRWTLDKASPGFPLVEAFSVVFDDYNPTYCVDEASIAKNKDITCTIKFDAKLAPARYTVATRSNGGEQTCHQSFLLHIAASED